MAPERKVRSTQEEKKAGQNPQATAVNQNISNERDAFSNDGNTMGLENETDTPGDSFFVNYVPHHNIGYKQTVIVDNFSLQQSSSAKINIHHEPVKYNTSPFVNDPLISHQSITNIHWYSPTTDNQVQHETQPQSETHSTAFINVDRTRGQDSINDNSNLDAISNRLHLHLHQMPNRTSDISPIRQWENSSMHEGPWDALASVPVYGGEGCGLDMEMNGDDEVGEGEEGWSMVYYAPSS